jgi:hypothetical protein
MSLGHLQGRFDPGERRVRSKNRTRAGSRSDKATKNKGPDLKRVMSVLPKFGVSNGVLRRERATCYERWKVSEVLWDLSGLFNVLPMLLYIIITRLHYRF